jgi:hypothetical protein
MDQRVNVMTTESISDDLAFVPSIDAEAEVPVGEELAFTAATNDLTLPSGQTCSSTSQALTASQSTTSA